MNLPLPLELQELLQRAMSIEIVADPAARPKIAASETQEVTPALRRCHKPSSSERQGSPAVCRWESYSEHTKQQPVFVASTSLLPEKSPFYNMARHHSLYMPRQHSSYMPSLCCSSAALDSVPRKPRRTDPFSTIHFLDAALSMMEDGAQPELSSSRCELALRWNLSK